MIPFPDKKYQIIYADPPWNFNQVVGIYQDGGRPDRFTKDHYSCMSLAEIKALPVSSIADKDCALFLWTTDAHLPEALQVINSWGFRYKTVAFIWEKLTIKGNLCANIGAWTMKNAELCLIGTKGNMVKYKKQRNIFQLVRAVRTVHSAKPEEVRRNIEALFGDLSRIELFARQKTEGWDAIGFDIDGKDITESIKSL